ncbi:MAG TPA: Vms1/Ankzf1 family peptidyl-tRNA hydrolase [Methanotrichaceae archaeon]|nr:Vms1/Ankzf1 family peptidyl-tRNA hydrolase [Methanotrichaceae archaeon]
MPFVSIHFTGSEFLVDLFGKKKLDDRIREMETSLLEAQKKNEELLATIEKRDEKIKKLTSAYQEANVALKAAEQRTASVEARLEPEKAVGQKPQGTKLTPREFERLIKKLSMLHSPEEDLLTAYAGISKALPSLPSLPSGLPNEAEKLIGTIGSDRGLAVLHFPQLFTLVLKPPLPMTSMTESSLSVGGSFQLDPLKELMDTSVLVISAHAGDTFLGVSLNSLNKEGFEAEELVKSQVKEKHSKGGWSQKRFERLREEDIKKHVEDVIEKLAEMKRKYGSVAKFAVLGGDPTLLKLIAPAVGLPVVERRLERHDEKRLDRLRDEVYGFTCYRL